MVASVGAMVMRAEVDALLRLRESEAALYKCIDKGSNVTRAKREVSACKANLHRVRMDREIADLGNRKALEDWWQKGPRGRCPRRMLALPDTFGICHIYDTAVPSRAIHSLDDVQMALNHADAATKLAPGTRLARAAAPATYCSSLATLQNLRIEEHAPLALLARWIINKRPTQRAIKTAATRFKVGKHVSSLCAFRSEITG